MPAPLLTADDLKRRGLAPASYSDADLVSLIAGETAFMVSEAGEHYDAGEYRIEEVAADEPGRALRLDRPAASINSVRAIVSGPEANWSTIAAADYRIALPDRLELRRTDGGRWLGEFSVSFTPVDDKDLRRVVLMDLIRTTLAYDGLTSLSQPGYTAAWLDRRLELVGRITSRRYA